MVTGGGQKGVGAGEITYSQLLQKVNAGQVKTAEIRGSQVLVTDNGAKQYRAVTPNNQDDLVRRLESTGANISVKSGGGNPVVSLLLQALPVLLLIGVWIFFMRQMWRRARYHGLRQVQGPPAHREQELRHLRRRLAWKKPRKRSSRSSNS